MRRLSPSRRPPPPRNRGHRSPGVPGDEPEVQIVNWSGPGSGSNLRLSRSERPLDRPKSRSRSRDKRPRISGEQSRRDSHRNSRDSRDLSNRDLRDSRGTGRDLFDSRGDLSRVLRDSMRDARELRDFKEDNRSLRDSRGDSRDLHDFKEESKSGLRDNRGDNRDHRNKGRDSSNQHLQQIKEKLNLVSKPSASFDLSYPQPLLGNGSKFEPPNQTRYDLGSNLITLTNSLKDDYLDPSVIGFRQNYSVIPETQVKSLNVQHSSRLDYKPPPSASTTPSSSKRQHEEEKPLPKTEKEDDRVTRLEKLVEKLVETTASTSVERKSIEVPHTASDSFYTEVLDHGELIPSSNKLTTSMWLNNLHDECLRRGFDEKSCIQYVKRKMTGIIKAWFKTVENYDFTWPELKLLITKTFPDNVDFATTLKLLVQREKMPEETITQYFFSKMYLCEACKITGENAVSCLIDGLANPFMKQDIRACNFLTPEVLFSEYFSKIPDNDNRGRIERQVETYQDYPPGELILMERERMDRIDMERMNRSMDYPQEYPLDLHPRGFHPRDLQPRDLHPRDVQPRGLPLREARPKCKTCKKSGHETIDCRHAPVCYKCKEKGHIQKKCPNGFVGVLTFAMGQLRKVPCVSTCQIKGIQFFAHIDTGCTVVTIIESAVRHLGLRIINSNMKLYGYGGAETKVLGAVHTKLKVDEVEDMMLLLVVPDQTQDFPLIIGQDFLNQRGVAVFIHQGEVRVFKYDEDYGGNCDGFGYPAGHIMSIE